MCHVLIKRWFYPKLAVLDIPLSHIMRDKVVQEWICLSINDFENYVKCTNQQLQRFRETNRIINNANPFPNLNVHESRYEFPLWGINSVAQKRYPIFIERNGKEIILHAAQQRIGVVKDQQINVFDNWIIVPRHSFTTQLLRLLCSDLFIHGKGGARYDRLTDQFIREYWGIKAPNMSVVSADNYLTTTYLNECRHRINKYKSIRYMAADLKDFLKDSCFSGEHKKILGLLLLDRSKSLQMINQASKQEKKQLSQTIRKIDKQIKEYISMVMRENQVMISQEAQELLNMREFQMVLFK